MGGIDPMKALAKARSDIYSFDPRDLILIGVDHGDSKHALYDRRVHNLPDERMVASLAEDGQIEPIVFRIEEIEGKWAPVVVEGRQRVINARELTRRRAEKNEPPFLLKAVKNETAKGSDHKAIAVMVSANAIRTQYSELEEAELAGKMMSEFGYSEEDAAKKFGVSVATLRRRMAVAAATDEVRHAYGSGEIPMAAAVELAKLQPAQQREAVVEVKAKAKAKQDTLANKAAAKAAPKAAAAAPALAPEVANDAPPEAAPSKAARAPRNAKTDKTSAAREAVKARGVEVKHREHLRSIKQVRALVEHLDGEVPSNRDREVYDAVRTVLGWVMGNDQDELELLVEGMSMKFPKGASDK